MMARTPHRPLLPLLLLLTAARGVFSQSPEAPPCAEVRPELYPCANVSSLRQSPIDIDTCGPMISIRRPLRITNQNTLPLRMTVENSGDRVLGEVLYAPGAAPTISGGILRGEYVYGLYDLHWGGNSSSGSEHGLHGYRHVGELHLGFRNTKYPSISEALGQVDGVVALAVFLSEDARTPGRGITALSPALFQIKQPLSSAELVSPPTMRELLPRNLNRYVQYDGSFTSVAPCAEAATWLVMLDAIRVVDVELDLLRDLRDDDGNRICTSANRPFQPLSGRKVYSKGAQSSC